MAITAAALLLLIHLTSVQPRADQTNMRAKPGDIIHLPCRAPDSQPVLAVEWSRSDLEAEYVLLFRDKQIDPAFQHPSFKNRVNLLDTEMKNGDTSLVLKNVTTADKGTYECRIFHRTNRNKRAVLDSDPVSTILLQVAPPSPDGDAQTQTGWKTSEGNQLKSAR
ncbi:hypothetical protein CHARACLAT_029209 [Characodon lateralis]|uniref:Ig-like domain-containing protein n=1 Tax=Characodon lateralis TaxID=208331 RepID=A0ABU7DWS8_9TELE|nr:hypothetical protein [Characodon lateralis]